MASFAPMTAAIPTFVVTRLINTKKPNVLIPAQSAQLPAITNTNVTAILPFILIRRPTVRRLMCLPINALTTAATIMPNVNVPLITNLVTLLRIWLGSVQPVTAMVRWFMPNASARPATIRFVSNLARRMPMTTA